MASDSWFRPKTHGYGAYPINWKGWLAIAVYIAATPALSLSLIVWPATSGTGPSAVQVVVWLMGVALATAVFIAICRARTEGQWRWRWGGS